MYIQRADCCIAETNTTMQSNYSPIYKKGGIEIASNYLMLGIKKNYIKLKHLREVMRSQEALRSCDGKGADHKVSAAGRGPRMKGNRQGLDDSGENVDVFENIACDEIKFIFKPEQEN